MSYIGFRVTILLAIIVLASIAVVPATSVSYGGVWTYVKADGVDFWPGQPLFYDGKLVVPFADATEQYLGLLFFDPDDLELVGYEVLETSWYPLLFRSFLYKDLAIMVDYAGGLVTYNFTSGEWRTYMLLNSSKWLMLFSDAYMDEDGYLYLVGWGGRYYAYSTIVKLKWNGTGFEKIWDAEVNIWNLPGNILVHGDKVYFATHRGVYAFDRETGRMVAEKKLIAGDPFKIYNMTLWWKNNRVHMLVYMHNNTTLDTDYDAVVHLELDPDTLSLVKAGRLYYTNGKPAHFCYFIYTEYPFVAGGEGMSCIDSARIIDVEKWLVAYLPYRYWLLGSEGTILHTFYSTFVRHGDDLYVVVQVSGIPATFDLMVFKAPANLLEVDNNTLFGDLARIYRLVEKPTTIIRLGEENLGGRNPGYTGIKYVKPKYYNLTNIRIEQYHTLNPYKETTTPTTPPSNTATPTPANTTTKTTTTTQTQTQTTPPTTTTTKTHTTTTPAKTNTTQATGTSKPTTPASTTTLTSSTNQQSVPATSTSTEPHETETTKPATINNQQTSTQGDTTLYIAIAIGVVVSIGVILAFIKKK